MRAYLLDAMGMLVDIATIIFVDVDELGQLRSGYVSRFSEMPS